MEQQLILTSKIYGREHSQHSGWRRSAEEGNRQSPAQERNRPYQLAAETVGGAHNQAPDSAARWPDRSIGCAVRRASACVASDRVRAAGTARQRRARGPTTRRGCAENGPHSQSRTDGEHLGHRACTRGGHRRLAGSRQRGLLGLVLAHKLNPREAADLSALS